jgi:hypothetical protein
MVCLSGTLARKGRSGQGSQDLYTTTLLCYSTSRDENLDALDGITYFLSNAR